MDKSATITGDFNTKLSAEKSLDTKDLKNIIH